MPVTYCGSRKAIDGNTNEKIGWLYGCHFISGIAPDKCPVCNLTLKKGAYMNKHEHNWTIYFCNKMSNGPPYRTTIDIPLDQPPSFSVCHDCGLVNYAYKDYMYLATHKERKR